MTLKEELEILRGEPIQVFDGDPMDVPCIETSDHEKLCKNPVVSVHMITYNHEPYIRQAIEGVIMQKTDFEFELIIGEDCSQDKTREICFEYQKKYPDKIRVLWWHENVSKLGGNGRRVIAHCRGEFIAFCEGDDYWVDPLKLQKQVDVMREHPSVGICFARSDRYYQVENRYDRLDDSFSRSGILSGEEFGLWNVLYRYTKTDTKLCQRLVETATILLRVDSFRKGLVKFADIYSWRLRFGDTLLMQLSTTCADVYFMKDIVSVYRINPEGAFATHGWEIMHDAYCIFAPYFLVNQFGYSLRKAVKALRKQIFSSWMHILRGGPYSTVLHVLTSRMLLSVFLHPLYFFDFLSIVLHADTRMVRRVTSCYRRVLAKLGCCE